MGSIEFLTSPRGLYLPLLTERKFPSKDTHTRSVSSAISPPHRTESFSISRSFPHFSPPRTVFIFLSPPPPSPFSPTPFFLHIHFLCLSLCLSLSHSHPSTLLGRVLAECHKQISPTHHPPAPIFPSTSAAEIIMWSSAYRNLFGECLRCHRDTKLTSDDHRGTRQPTCFAGCSCTHTNSF